MDQTNYLEGFHRSGWSFVMKNLSKLQNPKGIYCDTYVDRTFHWLKPNIIPYTKPWIGFVHHTFNTSYSDYNNVNLLKNQDFIVSLKLCKGLIVFTKVLQTEWESALAALNITVPVFAIVHPTEFVNNGHLFNISKWNHNPKQQLVQVGAWLRDTYAIYLVDTLNTIKKAGLVGPEMQNYFKPINFFQLFTLPSWKNKETSTATTTTPHLSVISSNGFVPQSVLTELTQSQSNSNTGMCRDLMCRDSEYALNKYVIGAINLLKSKDSTVVLIPLLSDLLYDTLLSQNIVFLKLVDAGAVNTILECIVRNTPMIVNCIPPVVEVLGPNYPMYYQNLTDIPNLLTLNTIESTTNYLNNMDKTPFKIETFMKSFEGILKKLDQKPL